MMLINIKPALYIFMFLLMFGNSISVNGDIRGIELVDPVDYIEDPEVDIKNEQEIEKVLPELEVISNDVLKLSDKTKILIKEIKIIGNTVLNKADIEFVVKPHLNRYINIEVLHKIRSELSKIYISKGFINSGVVLPDQEVVNGVIVYHVIEGRLSNILVKGNKALSNEYVLSKINLDSAMPLNVYDVQKELKKIQKTNLIDKVNAVLEPGHVLGESVLIINVIESKTSEISLNIHNHSPPSIGAEKLSVNYENINLTGIGDTALLSAGYSEGVNDLSISYAYPLPSSDDLLTIYYSINDSIVIEEPFSAIDLEGESIHKGVLYEYRLSNKLNGSETVLIGLESKESKSTILGVPIAFDPGANTETGEMKATVFQLGYDSINHFNGSILAYRVALRQGVDLFESTINTGNVPDSRFSVIQGQLQYAAKLNILNSQYFIRTSMQYSNDPLLSLEKFVIGGAASVRGYRENQYIRDTGIISTFEWQIPLSKNSRGYKTKVLQIIPFIDIGYGEDKDESVSQTESETLSSIGVGITWDPNETFHFEVYMAKALNDVLEAEDYNLQDDGIHFSMIYKTRF